MMSALNLRNPTRCPNMSIPWMRICRRLSFPWASRPFSAYRFSSHRRNSAESSAFLKSVSGRPAAATTRTGPAAPSTSTVVGMVGGRGRSAISIIPRECSSGTQPRPVGGSGPCHVVGGIHGAAAPLFKLLMEGPRRCRIQRPLALTLPDVEDRRRGERWVAEREAAARGEVWQREGDLDRGRSGSAASPSI
uniref:Uncharacterized protein n=1 Tax=Triticum urartu TaxID=4572 RepID=A0A8R7PIM2_TRIUA